MRIGIDIDDTITNTWECFIPYYSKVFDVSVDKLKSSMPYYSAVKDKYSIDEYFDKVLPIFRNITPIVDLKKDVKKIINKLFDDGNEIIFITARGGKCPQEYIDYIYNKSIQYLDSNGIKYNKVINNALDKAKICLEEGIELFIDDSINNCNVVSNEGISILLFETYYNKHDNKFRHVKNWKEIYEYIAGDSYAKK